MDLLDSLLDHDRWATRELLAACEGLSDAELDRSFAIGHGTLRETFQHIIDNPGFWTGLMLRERDQRRLDATHSLPELRERFERSYEAFAQLACQIRDEDRYDEIFIDHYDVRKSMGGTILTVILHNAEHRTEIVHMLARLRESEPPEVDLGAWDYERLNT